MSRMSELHADRYADVHLRYLDGLPMIDDDHGADPADYDVDQYADDLLKYEVEL